MNIFVGNLSFAATEADVRKLFEGFGSVASVRIVMEKKGIKSRGFGFVQMPDDKQAQDAIALLSGKEFMGRPLNVDQVRPKPEVEREKGEAKKIRIEVKAEGQHYLREDKISKDAWFNPVFNKKRGRYKTGRRSRSFMKRSAASGIAQEAMPNRDSRENPMRWRKKNEQPKPWQKGREERKPPEKGHSIEHRPWKKTEDKPRPWKKSRREPTIARRKSSKRPRPHQSRIQSRRKPGGYTR